MISASFKRQKKYLSVSIKIEFSTFQLAIWSRRAQESVWQTDLVGTSIRWFPAQWTLHERKTREKFQLALKDLPVILKQEDIWKDGKLVPFFSGMNIKAHKVVHMPDKTRK